MTDPEGIEATGSSALTPNPSPLNTDENPSPLAPSNCSGLVMTYVLNTYYDGGQSRYASHEMRSLDLLSSRMSPELEQNLAEEEIASGGVVLGMNTFITTDQGVEDAGKIKQLNELIVSGNTSLANTNVAGTLMIGGMISLQDNTINSISPELPLKIQSFAQAPVEFMGGLIHFGTDGSIETAGNVKSASIQTDFIQSSDEFAGVVVIPAGEAKIAVEQTWEKKPKTLILTASSKGEVWHEQIRNEGFEIHIDAPHAQDIEIHWLAVW